MTLWEALAGQRLFDGTSEVDIIGKVLRCRIPPLPSDVGVAPATEAVVRHMLEADPDGRYSSTAEAFTALLACPEYTSDGGGLEKLMREIFGLQSLALPPTLPLDAALGGPATPRSQDGTKPGPMGQSGSGTALAELVAFPGNTTPAVEPPATAWRPVGLGDGVPVPRPPEGVLDSSTFPEHERSITGSAYVSTADGMLQLGRRRSTPRAAGLIAATFAGLVGVGLVVFFVRRPSPDARQTSPGAAAVDPPRPPARRPVVPQVPDDPPEPTSAPEPPPPAEQPSVPPESRPSVEALVHEKHPRRPGHAPKPPTVSMPEAEQPPRVVEKSEAPERVQKKDETPAAKPSSPAAPGVTNNGSPVLQ